MIDLSCKPHPNKRVKQMKEEQLQLLRCVVEYHL